LFFRSMHFFSTDKCEWVVSFFLQANNRKRHTLNGSPNKFSDFSGGASQHECIQKDFDHYISSAKLSALFFCSCWNLFDVIIAISMVSSRKQQCPMYGCAAIVHTHQWKAYLKIGP
jgi:hypothetical protein